mgnify:CR=1 FL=1
MKCNYDADLDMKEQNVMSNTDKCAAQIIIPRGGRSGSRFITVPCGDNDTIQSITERAMNAVQETGATIVSMDIMGLPLNEGVAAVEEVTGPVTWPITWIAEADAPMAGGIQIWAECDAKVTPIKINTYLAGSLVETDDATLCRLGGLNGRIPTRTRPEQTIATLNQMERALKAVDMGFEHTIRTWFYNCDIVCWYDEFNKARDEFFRDHHVYEGLVPASTGIGACNISGSAIMCGLLALKAKSDAVTMQAVPSPLQCPATDYGSSFSRAAEIQFTDYRQLLISGTASIEPEGKTIHQDDIDGQIRCTLEVVEAILKSRNMDWANTTRAIAYVKHADDLPRFEKLRSALGLDALPVVTLIAEVCRDDLLFEIEIDAIAE